MSERAIISVSGADRTAFLQDLVSNDITPKDRLIWAALLTPQGKYLVDFFVQNQSDNILLDVADSMADALLQRLTMYRLRRDVTLARADLQVQRGTGPAPDGAHADPRHPAMGWRRIGSENGSDTTDWDAIRVAHCIPETGIELIANDTYPLEAGFERLHGVDFRKGCYVGQEVTARMKHKTDLKKGLLTVAIEGSAPVGCKIMAGEKEAGTLFTQSGNRAIAYLRLDRAKGGDMVAENARIFLL